MRRTAKIIGLLITALVGCATVGQLAIYRQRPIRFSHESHGVKAELTCVECHQGAETEDRAGMPAGKACALCHKTKEEREKFLTPFLVARPDGKKDILFTSVTKLPEDLKFSHKQHLDAKLGCADCHGDVEHSAAVSADFRVAKDRCFECHEGSHVSSDCLVCHEKIDADWSPPSHQQIWTRRHGLVARLGDHEASENRCELCHQDAGCATCHQDQPPANHNNHWRHRAHGLAAAVDAEGCATCHRTDSCERCHAETAPRTHVASWGGTQNKHCLGCHLPASTADACNVCHRGAPSHLTAPPRPGNPAHAQATDGQCRTCHTAFKLQHLDNGDGCLGCHR